MPQACWPALEATQAVCTHASAAGTAYPETLATALCETYVSAMRAGGQSLVSALHQLLSASTIILSASGKRDSACSALLALATSVEVFGKLDAASELFAKLLVDVNTTVGAPLSNPSQLAEAPELVASYLDLLYRCAIFCPTTLFSVPQVVHAALELLVHSLRQQAGRAPRPRRAFALTSPSPRPHLPPSCSPAHTLPCPPSS